MTTNHIVTSGSLETAQLALLNQGGQLFPARDSEGPFVHVRGSTVTTYWPPNSKRRGYVIELAKSLDFDPHIATTGRIVRHLVDNVLGSPHKETYFCSKWRGLAIKGNHWHYLHCSPGRYEYCIEIDLKSAYWAAFSGEKSMLLNQHKEFMDDGGALESLKAIMPGLPKAFRVALLGTFASWRNTLWVRDSKDPSGENIICKQVNEIKYGAAFNATHRAILKVWKVMEALHKMCGEDVVRIHTDGIMLNCMNGMKWEQELDDFLHRHGFEYTVKAQGDTWMIDANTGICGRKLMGAKRLVIDAAKESGVKINLNAAAPPMKIFDKLSVPPSISGEVCMDSIGIPTQPSLDFAVNNIV